MRWGRPSSEIHDKELDSLVKDEGRQDSQQETDSHICFLMIRSQLPSEQVGLGNSLGMAGSLGHLQPLLWRREVGSLDRGGSSKDGAMICWQRYLRDSNHATVEARRV